MNPNRSSTRCPSGDSTRSTNACAAAGSGAPFSTAIGYEATTFAAVGISNTFT
jgi:hypothetical protein